MRYFTNACSAVRDALSSIARFVSIARCRRRWTLESAMLALLSVVTLASPLLCRAAFIVEPGFKRGMAIHIRPGFNRPNWYWPRFTETKSNTFRMDLKWGWVEQVKGQYVLDSRMQYVDEFLLGAKAKGISPVLILDFGNKFYDGGGFPVSDA